MALAWCFEDEKTSYTEALLDLLAEDSEALVPVVWPLEVTNALLSAERHRRMTIAQTTHFLERLSGFPIHVEEASMAGAVDSILPKAREWKLTTYDASYIDLALRRNLPLATLDAALKKAAQAVGVPLFHR